MNKATTALALFLSVFFGHAILGTVPLESPQGDPIGLCECELKIDGEGMSGDNVDTPITSSGSGAAYNGTATLENHDEIRGICNLGEGSDCTSTASECEWNLAMSISVSAESLAEVPTYFKIGGVSTDLVDQGNGIFTGTSETSRFDKVACEQTQTVTVRIRAATGNLLAEAEFTLRCLDCPAAGM
jgi:hypothetical protein